MCDLNFIGGNLKMDTQKKLEDMVVEIDSKLPYLEVGRDNELISELMKLKYNILLTLEREYYKFYSI